MEKRIFMKRLLITGFMPFGGEEINPSWEAVCALPDRIGEYELTKMLLPVVFGEAAKIAIAEVEKISADAVLSVGQAGGRAEVCPELVGINLKNATVPDNGGNQPKDEPIAKGGAAAYFSTLPARKIADAISAAGIPARLSYSAGAYVCNELLYSLLRHFEGKETAGGNGREDRQSIGENGTKVRVGFIHVPYISEQGKAPSMSLGDIKTALKIAIENLD